MVEAWAWPKMPNKGDTYYEDMICGLYWKKLAEVNNLDALQEINTIYETIFSCIRLSDEERQRRENEKRETEERLAIRRQCRACAWESQCKMVNTRKECTAFEPK